MSGPGGFAPGSQQDLAATAGDRVFFAYDQSDISSEGQQILQRQADWLKRYSQVERDHRRAIATSAAPASTISRSASAAPRRSRTSSSRWAYRRRGSTTISYGKERPIVVGSSEEGYAQNRVGITMVNGG